MLHLVITCSDTAQQPVSRMLITYYKRLPTFCVLLNHAYYELQTTYRYIITIIKHISFYTVIKLHNVTDNFYT